MLYCIVFYCTTLHYSTLHYTALHCISKRCMLLGCCYHHISSPSNSNITGGGDLGSVNSSQSTRRLVLALSLLANSPSLPSSSSSFSSPSSKYTQTNQTNSNTSEHSNITKNTILALAATLAGCTVRTSDRNNAFPRHIWIPSGFKCHILNELNCPTQAGLDLLSERPDMQDIFLDPESESGGSEVLPHPYSSLGRLITTAALYIVNSVLHPAENENEGTREIRGRDRKKEVESLNVARVLFDLAGRDDFLCGVLVLINESDIGGSDSSVEMMKAVLHTARTDGDCPNAKLEMMITDYLDGNRYATKYLKSLVLPCYDNQATVLEKEEIRWRKRLECSYLLDDKIVLRTLGGIGRRTFLLNVKNVPQQSSRSQSIGESSLGAYVLFIKYDISYFIFYFCSFFNIS